MHASTLKARLSRWRGRCHAPSPLGTTLLELCFALALLALVAGFAAPGLRASLRAAAVRSAALDLMAGLQQVRTHSILEARPGALCLTSGDVACPPAPVSGAAWQTFLESAHHRETLGGGPLPRDIVVRANRSPLRFWPHARAASTGTLTICDAQAIAAPRAIVVSQSGRARMKTAPAAACAD